MHLNNFKLQNRYTNDKAFLEKSVSIIQSRERFYLRAVELKGSVSFAHSRVVSRWFNDLDDEYKHEFGYIFGQMARHKYGLYKGKRIILNGIRPTLFNEPEESNKGRIKVSGSNRLKD